MPKPKNTKQLLEDWLAQLNDYCVAGERYLLVHHPRSHQAENGYIQRGYYLLHQSPEEEWRPDGHEEVGQLIGTTGTQAQTYFRELIKERQRASSGLGDWWQTRSRSLERQRQRRRSGQSTPLPTPEEEVE